MAHHDVNHRSVENHFICELDKPVANGFDWFGLCYPESARAACNCRVHLTGFSLSNDLHGPFGCGSLRKKTLKKELVGRRGFAGVLAGSS